MKQTVVASGLSALLCATPCPASMFEAPSTVGRLVQNNGMLSNGWFVVKTPSILRFQESAPLKIDERIALDAYDAVIDSSAETSLRAEAMWRAAALNLTIAQRQSDPRSKHLSRAVALYDQLGRDDPEGEHGDEALYLLARAYQLAEVDSKTLITLLDLTRRYPKSLHASDAAFRAAEMLYSEGRYSEAEAQYRVALEGGSMSFAESARYKLSWALYRQQKFELALPFLFDLLEKYLPLGELDNPAAALALTDRAHAELMRDSLRLTDLTLMAMGGVQAIDAYISSQGKEARFAALLYVSLANTLIERARYSESAAVSAAFVARHPSSRLAPAFLSRQIAALNQGGFVEKVIEAKVGYVRHFEPGAAFWGKSMAMPEVLAVVHVQLEDIAQYHHARSQRLPESEKAEREAGFAEAALTYRKLLTYFPQDPNRAQFELQLADVLLAGNRLEEAAITYEHVAYGYGKGAVAQGAAFAAIQVYQQAAMGATGDDKSKVLLASVEASVRLGEVYPSHPQRVVVLVRAAQDLHRLGNDERAIVLATPMTRSDIGVDPALRKEALIVVSDAYYARNDYAHAEIFYRVLLDAIDQDPGLRAQVTERLATSIYKQGEIARSAGDLQAAARAFSRVGDVVPDGALRASADYDAAQALVALRDWPAAQQMLEGFLRRFPLHPLKSDADKMLAEAYAIDEKYASAAPVYERVSNDSTQSTDTRANAVWLAARSYDIAANVTGARRTYASYVAYPGIPTSLSLSAQVRLADLALQEHDITQYRRWLEAVIQTDRRPGSVRSEETREAAAKANLALGRMKADEADSIVLGLPLSSSLPARQKAMKEALANFDDAAGYGYADVSTAAAFEAGLLYRAFSLAIEQAPAPSGIGADELGTYRANLAREARPFNERALSAFAANVDRAAQGVWNEFVRDSAVALATMAPELYGKHDERESVYASIR